MADNRLRSTLIYSAPPPSPVPTGRGSRSASGSVLSDYIDKAIRVPQLTLPDHKIRHRLEEISYGMIQLKDDGSIKSLLRSAREFGVFRISEHGIMTEELESALERSDRVFGVMADYCTSYGDHEKLEWSSVGHQISDEASALIGAQNFQIFREEMKRVSSELEAIGEGVLARIIGTTDAEQVGESTMSIYRYHRANMIERIPSVDNHEEEERKKDEDPYALSVHLILEPGEICVQYLESGKWSSSSYFQISENTIVVTLGKQLEKWRYNGELKSCQGKVVFKPFVHSKRASYSIDKKWTIIFTNDRHHVLAEAEAAAGTTAATTTTTNDHDHQSKKIISVSDQILFALLLTLFYNFILRLTFSM